MNDSPAEIRKKTVAGIKWVGIAELAVRIIQLASTILLATLLGPDTFGTFGICLILFRLITAIGDAGLGTVLIQAKNLQKAHIDTIFSFSLLFSLLLTGAAFRSAEVLQDFFNFKDMAGPLRGFSCSFVLVTYATLLRSLCIRKLDFHILTLGETIAVLLNAITAIGLAYNGFGIWCLILGLYVEHLALIILLSAGVRWFPRPGIRVAVLQEIAPFAGNVLLARLAYFTNTSIDKLLIGKFLGEHMLGIYVVAYNLVDMPVQRISKNVIKVTFSTLSHLQDNRAEFIHSYRAITYYLGLIVFPLYAGLFVIAPEFTAIFYGSIWMEMIIPLRMLCAAGLFRSLVVISSTTLLALNKPGREAGVALFQGILLFLFIVLSLNHGIAFVTAAVSVSYLAGFAASLMVSLPVIKLTLRDYLRLIRTPLGEAGIIVLLGLVNSMVLRQFTSDIMFMCLNLLIGGSCCLLFLYLCDRTVLARAKRFLAINEKA